MRVRLERRYPSRALAARIWRSVVADNPGFVSGRLTGDRLVIEVSHPSPASLRATLDDLIACIAAAERAGPVARPPKAK